jgi:hypothetical protein
MAQLPAGPPPALLALAPRASLQAIAGGRFMAVVAVLGQLPPQGRILGQHRRDLFALLSDQGFELGDAFVWRHASMLHPHGKTG